MFRSGKWTVPVVAVAVAWGDAAFFQHIESTAHAADPKAADLTSLREAVNTASKRGANVDEVIKALDALEKALPTIKPGRVPPELQALRDAVDAAARKGENVDEVQKQLTAVEMAVAGHTLAKPRPPEVRPDVPPRPNPRPNPFPPNFPIQPFPAFPNAGGGGGLGGGIDVDTFNKAMELRKKALDLMVKNPRDPETLKASEKLLTQANELMLKSLLGAAGGGGGGGALMPAFPAFPVFPAFPGFDIDDVPERPRLGIRMERIPAVAAEQLGIGKNTGIAVAAVTPGSAAEKAGLQVHDIILEFAGKPVTDSTDDFARRVNAVKAGTKVDLVLLRKGKKVEVKGIDLPAVAKRPAQPQLPFPALPPGLLPNAAPVKPMKAFPQPPPPLPLPNAVPVPK